MGYIRGNEKTVLIPMELEHGELYLVMLYDGSKSLEECNLEDCEYDNDGNLLDVSNVKFGLHSLKHIQYYVLLDDVTIPWKSVLMLSESTPILFQL